MYAMHKLSSMGAMLCDIIVVVVVVVVRMYPCAPWAIYRWWRWPYENECMGSIGMVLRMAAFGRRGSAFKLYKLNDLHIMWKNGQ